MSREVQPCDTTRAEAYQLWMKAPDPMVTFFKTLDVTDLLKAVRRKNMKFNMLMEYCVGKAASGVSEFYILPVGEKLIQYDSLDGRKLYPYKYQNILNIEIELEK